MNETLFFLLTATRGLCMVVGLLAAVFGTLIFFGSVLEKNRSLCLRRNAKFFIPCILGGLMVAIPFFATKAVEGKTFLLRNGEVVAVFEQSVFRFQKNYNQLAQGCQLLSYESVACLADMHLNPITTNPKVRDLRYVVHIQVKENPQARLSFLKTCVAFGSTKGTLDGSGNHVAPPGLTAYLTYHLYEFNEAKSKELAELYNPLDANQQSRFAAMVVNFLSETLSRAGCEVVSAGFRFP